MASPPVARDLRVLLVDLAEDAWGAERVALELAPHLDVIGVRLELLAPSGPFASTWVEQGFRYHPLSLPAHASIRTPTGGRNARDLVREATLALRVATRIARLARSVDVVHSNHLFSHLDSVLAGTLARRPVVVHVHDFVKPGVGHRLLRIAGSRAAAVGVTSAAVGSRLGLSTRARVEVLHPALDLTTFSPGRPNAQLRADLGAVDGETVLVGVLGRLDRVKGVDLVIRAMAGLDSNFRLAVVGGPLDASADEVADLERLGHDALGDRVRFLGPRADVVDVLRSVDILVSAARDEPFGASILEAQACGRAVVVSDVGGHGEHVTDGRTGLVVPPEDPERLGLAIARLACDPDLRERLGAAARTMVEELHDVRAAAARVARLYADLARSPS